LFETQSATLWFLQYLLVRPIVFYSTSNYIKTRLIKWKQGPAIQSFSYEVIKATSINQANSKGKTRQGRGSPSVIPKEDFGQLLFPFLENQICFNRTALEAVMSKVE